MAAALATPDQIRAIHTLKSKNGLREEDYRARLSRAGVSSSKELTIAAAAVFINGLQVARAPVRAVAVGARSARDTVSGPFAGKLRALWLSGWNLGVFRERDDTALIAFVTRQTGIAHTRWLQDPADARRAIEALKAMLARDGGVAWPQSSSKPGSVPAMKLAVLEAQLARLAALGAPAPTPEALAQMRAYPDRHQPILGRAIRKALTAGST